MEYLPFKPYSVDNYKSALTPNVCTGPFPAIFNLHATRLEYIVGTYLGEQAKQDTYAQYRKTT
jgi:hypothetical protein